MALAPRDGEPEYAGEVVRHEHDDELRERLHCWCETTPTAPRVAFASTVRGAVQAAGRLRRVDVSYTSALNPLLVPNDVDDRVVRGFHDRLGGGESYHDLIARLEPCLPGWRAPKGRAAPSRFHLLESLESH